MIDLSKISRAECKVLHLLMIGDPNKIIAYKLGIGEATVKAHIKHLFRKLGATNRTQLAYIAGTLGIES